MLARILVPVVVVAVACGPSTAPPRSPAASERPPAKPVALVEGCAEVDLCQRQCERDHTASCARLGLMLTRGEGARARVGRAMKALARGCTEIGEACRSLGLLHLSRLGGGDEERALELFDFGCGRGDPLSCALVERYHPPVGRDRGVDAVTKRASDIYYAGCEEGRASACASVKHYRRALELYIDDCRGGAGAACYGVGKLARAGRGIAADPVVAEQWFARAASIHQEACARGEPEACASLAEQVLSGEGVESSPSAAARLLARGCDGAFGLACARLARYLERGEVPELGSPGPQELILRACDVGHFVACAAVEVDQLPPPTNPADLPVAERTAMPEPALVESLAATLVAEPMTIGASDPDEPCEEYLGECERVALTVRGRLPAPYRGVALIETGHGDVYLSIDLASGPYIVLSPTPEGAAHEELVVSVTLVEGVGGPASGVLRIDQVVGSRQPRPDDPLAGLLYEETLYCGVGPSGRPSCAAIRTGTRSRAGARVASPHRFDPVTGKVVISAPGEASPADGYPLTTPGEYAVQFP